MSKKALVWLVIVVVAVVLLIVYYGGGTPEEGVSDTVESLESDLDNLQLEDLESEVQGLEEDLQQL